MDQVGLSVLEVALNRATILVVVVVGLVVDRHMLAVVVEEVALSPQMAKWFLELIKGMERFRLAFIVC